MNCDYTDKIIDYLDDNLNELEKKDFENYLKNNKQFQDTIEDIKYQSRLIKNLPKYKASSDFMLNLNKRIDEHFTVKQVRLIFKKVNVRYNYIFIWKY